jgi:hypothetical protein
VILFNVVEGWSIATIVGDRDIRFVYPAGDPPDSVRGPCESFEEELRSLFVAEGEQGFYRRAGTLDADGKTQRRVGHGRIKKLRNLLLQRSHIRPPSLG